MPVAAAPVAGPLCVCQSGDCSCSLPSGELIRSSPAAAAVDGCMGAVPAKASRYQACSACSTQRLAETECQPAHFVPGLQHLQPIALPATEWLPVHQVTATPSIWAATGATITTFTLRQQSSMICMQACARRKPQSEPTRKWLEAWTRPDVPYKKLVHAHQQIICVCLPPTELAHDGVQC